MEIINFKKEMKHFRFAGLESRFFRNLDLVQWAKGQNLELGTGNFKLNRVLRLHAIFTCNMYVSLPILLLKPESSVTTLASLL